VLYRRSEAARQEHGSPAVGLADLRGRLPSLSPAGIRRVLSEMEQAGYIQQVAGTTPEDPHAAWAWIEGVPLPPVQYENDQADPAL
jgi:hypothetical protein